MIFKKLINKPFTHWVFMLAGVILILSCVKYILLPGRPESGFYLFEAVALLLFLILLFLTEKGYQNLKHKISSLEKNNELEKNQLYDDYLRIQKRLSVYEQKENENKELEIHKEKIIKLIFDRKPDDYKKYSFLHILSQATQALAAIIYTETKPSAGFTVKETYGLSGDYIPAPFALGEGINGQVAVEGLPLLIEKIPEDYFQIHSGLGEAKPKYIYLLPVMNGNICVALIELATFNKNEIEKIWNLISGLIVEKEIL